MATVCGVEEAGRGPVIGPLVMCGLLIDEKDEQKLKGLGVKDSKLLLPAQRERLYDQILKIAKAHKVVIIQADEVDGRGMANLNLNQLEAVKSAQIINALKPDKVILDCPSTNCKAYELYLKKRLDNPKIQLIAEHKADVKYPVVSAASIIAKVTRDREIEEIKKRVGIDFGSGYPSDPKTADFLEKYQKKFPQIFRETWDTYKQATIKKEQKKLFDYGDDDLKEDVLSFENKTEKDINTLEKQGFKRIAVKNKYEKVRLSGICTVVLYSTGKLVVQGKKEAVAVVKKWIG